MDLLLVALGGACGSLARFLIGKGLMKKSAGLGFSLGTFLVNITGAVLLGLVISLSVGENLYLLLGEGFLGAYTTFSTFMYEGFTLFQGNAKLNALLYTCGSLALGIAGFIAGTAAATLF